MFVSKILSGLLLLVEDGNIHNLSICLQRDVDLSSLSFIVPL